MLRVTILLLMSANAAFSATARPGTSFLGYLESRPQWQPEAGSLNALHAAALGYQPSDNVQLTLKQYFVQDYRKSGQMALENGYLEARVYEFLRSDDGRTTLGYRARGYIPLNEFKRERGLLTVIRNYLVVKHVASSVVRFTAMYTPTVHLYSEDGYTRKKGAHANPYFENRFYFAADFNLGAGFVLYAPIKVSSLRYANYRSGAENNDQWKTRVWFHPLMLYWFNPTTAVGAGYSTDNFLGQSPGDAFKKGTAQLVLHAGL